MDIIIKSKFLLALCSLLIIFLPIQVGAIVTCAATVDGNGTARCLSSCNSEYPLHWSAGDGGCRQNNSATPLCCGTPGSTSGGVAHSSSGVVETSVDETANNTASNNNLNEQSLPKLDGLLKATPIEIIGNIIKSMLGLAGTLTIIMMVYAGILWMTASGNETAVTKAKKIITWTVIGLVLIFTSYIIVRFLFTSLGY